MVTIVMPSSELLPILSIVCWIIFSELPSSALVASSKKSTDGFLISARAMAIRCFCPPENCEPPLPTHVSNLSGRSSMKPSWACRATRSTSASVAFGLPCIMFALTDVAKSTGS
mmetsp:Transcript_34059/g.79126  ORF Transcript_34059/g.79126 Transcript_34059/m.79126 type:complete len:114 (-) Transcript_34059:862-1203(-)